VRVVVASRNRHKLREIGVLLADAGLAWDLVSIDEIAPACALVEDEPSFEGNPYARRARQQPPPDCRPWPTIRASKWMLSTEPRACTRRDGVVSPAMMRETTRDVARVAGVPTEKRTARYRCAAAFVDPARGLELVRMGACEGRLLESLQGTGGFGYDPLFFIESLGLTMAEIPLEGKNRLSHRAAAFRELARALAAFHLLG